MNFLLQEVDKQLINFFIKQGFEKIPLSKTNKEMEISFPLGKLKKTNGNINEMIEVQFDKYERLSFVINFGRVPDNMVDEVEIFKFQQDNEQVFRLYSNNSIRWFKLGFLSKPNENNLRKLVEKSVILSSEIISWFNGNIKGNHMKQFYGFITL